MIRRMLVTASAVLLIGGSLAAPAQAEEPEVEVTSSVTTARPGESVTVTVKLTNIHGFSVLQPRARLFSTPRALADYATLVSCTGAASCTAVNDGNGNPIGYQGALAEALGGFQTATVTFTLALKTDAVGGVETLRGELFGSNYATPLIDGPQLTVHTESDLSVNLTGTPRFGLLVPRVDFAVDIRNHGPNKVLNGTVTATLPPGVSATSSDCTVSGNQVSCPVTNLAPGAGKTVTYATPLRLLNIGLPYKFQAARTATDPTDVNAANDKSSVECTVVTAILVSCR
ncbi:hypothetical protein [Lentzea sp. NPDC051838]|uniref:hypothetical protein n=1 Tax=Lentzea sp. NPDC051838 TaxID=3154849 RepID=UPI003440481A